MDSNRSGITSTNYFMKLHKKYNISGKVHGVGFRFSCMEKAYQHNINGFVSNKSNGSVYVEAEGKEKDLDLFMQWLSKGPVWAKVSSVTEEEGNLKGYSSFEIMR